MPLNRMRQTDIINPEKTEKFCITVVGAGAIGSFTVLSLAKLGVPAMRVYDEDGVSDHNLPNQFYRVEDARDSKFKVDALKEIVRGFGAVEIEANREFYVDQPLEDIVVVCTDSMESRRLVWDQFKKQQHCQHYIEARMGGEIARMYCISKIKNFEGIEGNHQLLDADIKFYESMLYSDAEAAELPCTARAVIYNVLMISSLMCRAFKAIANGESAWPREVIFNMAQMEEPSLVYMTTK